MAALTDTERMIVDTVHDFVDRDVRPVVRDIEHANDVPRDDDRADEGARHLRAGDPRALGGTQGVDAVLRARHRGAGPRLDEPGRGDGRAHRGRQAARRVRHAPSSRPRTCRGWRPARSGRRWRSPSRAAAPTCRRCAPSARRDGDGYVVNGSKTWITNARRSQLIALLCKTDPAAQPAPPRRQHPAGRARARASRSPRTCPSSATRAWRAAS